MNILHVNNLSARMYAAAERDASYGAHLHATATKLDEAVEAFEMDPDNKSKLDNLLAVWAASRRTYSYVTGLALCVD